MNPNEQAYEALKKWQKALSLTDSDTQLVPPSSGQENRTPANPKDVEFYKKQYQDAMERGYPLSDRDRRELESLRQVLHLKDEDALAIEQQLARTVLQTNETTVEPAGMSSPSPNIPVESPSINDFESARTPTPPPHSSTQPASPDSVVQNPQFQGFSDLTPQQEQVVRQWMAVQAAGTSAAPSMNEPWPQSSENAGSNVPAANPTVVQPDPSHPPHEVPAGDPSVTPDAVPPPSETTTVQNPSEASSPVAVEPVSSAPPANLGKQSAKVKVDRRPWLISMGLLGITLGILAGAWLAARTYLVPPTRDPAAAGQLFQSGTQQAKQGQNAKAIADLDRAIQLNPNDPNLYLNRGIAHYQEGNLSAALNDYNQALKLNPNLAEAWSNRSQLYVTQRRYDEAVNDASKAIQLNPNLTEAYLNRGNAQFGRNNLDGAAQDYQKVLQLPDPANQSKAHNNLGNIRAARNQLDTAITSYDQAIQLVRSYADAFYNRALALARKNQCPEAVQGFRDAANLYQSQGNSEMSQRAQRNVERLQKCITPPGGSPQPSPTSSV